MKQEKAIIYCAIEKCPHIFDSTIDYCNNENFNIVNSYILNTDIKGLNLYKMKKRKRQESIETINTLKERISQLEQIIEKLVKDK